MDYPATNTYEVVPGQGDSHTGPGADESEAGLATPEFFDFEQWELDQELQGVWGRRDNDLEQRENLEIHHTTAQPSSIDIELNELLETITPQATTVIPVTLNDSSFEDIPQHDVLSWESSFTTSEWNSISLPSNAAVNRPCLSAEADPINVPLRHNSTSSGYDADHGNRTTTENTTSSKGRSFNEPITNQVRNAVYVSRPRHGLPTTKSNSRNKSRQAVSTVPSRLTPDDVTTQDCFFVYRNILPKVGSQESPSSHTEPDVLHSPLPSQKGKRRPNTDDDRKKIKLVRRVGACIRCRIFKEKCDENTPCGRCNVALANPKVYQLDCYRESLNNVLAFRAGNARAGKIRSESMSPKWSSDDIRPRYVALSYPFRKPGAGAGIAVTVECRKFIPYEWDVMEEPWKMVTTGEVISMKSSSFACYDQNANVANVAGYIKATKAELLEESLDGVSDQLLRLTTAEATRYCLKYENTAVATAMNIRAASFFSRTKMIMIGTNEIELPYFGDRRYLLNGGYPVPGILDYQVDYMAIRYMLGQMDTVVKQLKKLIFTANQKKSWYEVYLTIFVLLQSLETVHARQLEILQRYEGRDREAFATVRIVATRMIEEWQYSAKILIYHYRAVLKGMVPFAAVWSDKHVAELRKDCGLDEKSLEYARQMSEIIRSREDSLKQLSKECLDNVSAKSLVWIAQLYVDDTSSS